MARSLCTFLMVAAYLIWDLVRVHADPIQLPVGPAIKKIDFERHVHALLDRQGCNAGKCHGNRDGRGGFSLGLLAATPATDHMQIVRSIRGRHLNLVDPDQSLLLLKATGRLKHEAGIRVAPQSWEYQVLRKWIADGAVHEIGRGKIKSLHVVPAEHVFAIGERLQIKVLAQFADGTREDVTPFSDFRAPEQEVLRLTRTGEIHAVKPGDVAIPIFYRGQMRIMRAMVAYPVMQDFVYPEIPETNFIDREVFRQLHRLNIVPSERCSDEHFLRRVFIDIIGTIPTPAEVRAFVGDHDPEKRVKKIDELLAHPRHATVLATRFCEITDMIARDSENAKSPRAKAAQMAHDWFRVRHQKNMRYDHLVEAILTATSKDGRGEEVWLKEKAALERTETGFGSDYARRTTLDHYWRIGETPRAGDETFGHFGRTSRRLSEGDDAVFLEDVAERTASAFLGVTLECARCHDHPTDGWTPLDHRAFANVFGQVRLEKPASIKGTIQSQERAMFAREVFVSPKVIQLTERGTGAMVKPRLLGGAVIDFQTDARQTLVRWMAQPDNPFFARHFVNSTWEHYFGVSLIASTHSYASKHPVSHAPLLDLLAKDFISHQFDIRWLERTILLSRTYQLSAINNASNKHDRTNFSRIVAKRHSTRIAADLLHAALETAEDFGTGVPAGLTAIEVMHLGPTGAGSRYDDSYSERIGRLLDQFGRKGLVSRCDNDPNLRSYLMLYSGAHVQGLLANSKRIQRLAKSNQSLDATLDECFLATMSRLPTSAERKVANEHLQREFQTSRQRAIETIFWAMINTKEFMARH